MEQGPSVLRQLPAFVQNMTDGDATACQFDHRSIADVLSVENVIDACKMSSKRRIEQVMDVGNHSNPNGSALVHGAAIG